MKMRNIKNKILFYNENSFRLIKKLKNKIIECPKQTNELKKFHFINFANKK